MELKGTPNGPRSRSMRSKYAFLWLPHLLASATKWTPQISNANKKHYRHFPPNLLGNLDVTVREQEFSLVKKLFDKPLEPKVTSLLRSKALESYCTDLGLGFMMEKKGYRLLICIQAINSLTISSKGSKIPPCAMCSQLKEDLTAKNNQRALSTDTIFESVKNWIGPTNPFPYGGISDGTNFKSACHGARETTTSARV